MEVTSHEAGPKQRVCVNISMNATVGSLGRLMVPSGVYTDHTNDFL